MVGVSRHIDVWLFNSRARRAAYQVIMHPLVELQTLCIREIAVAIVA